MTQLVEYSAPIAVDRDFSSGVYSSARQEGGMAIARRLQPDRYATMNWRSRVLPLQFNQDCAATFWAN
ncbi:MAG: hypothetical protein AAF773_04120 [Cyanobacteria bacterium P01_D01_bin.115]